MSCYTTAHRIRQFINSCLSEGRPRPTSEEIADQVGVEAELVPPLLETTRRAASLSSRTESGDGELGDFIADPSASKEDDSLNHDELRERINEILGLLDPREKEILEMRYGINGRQRNSLEQVKAHFQVSRERIRQIQLRALAKLSRLDETRKLLVYLNS